MPNNMLPRENGLRAYFNDRIRRFLKKRGYAINRIVPPAPRNLPPEMDATIRAALPYTATSVERLTCLIDSVNYLERYRIPGDIVECGVFRGGSIIAAALTLLRLGSVDRHLYLFDTFTGMPEPSYEDVDLNGCSAKLQLENPSIQCIASLDDVRKAVLGTLYPEDKIHFVKGMVEDTIPQYSPDRIALLRLDTDWYQSTKHELIHLYPRLVNSGVLIIDDYGHWQGARKAADEYIRELKDPILLNRIDYTGRVIIKTNSV
jgi:hypothetical protein